MKKHLLPAAILFGLSLPLVPSLCLASPADAQGTLPLQDLHALMGSPGPFSRQAGDDVLLWFTDEGLQRDSTKRASAVAAYRRGVPVAVLRGPVDPAIDVVLQGLFGVASDAQLAVYQRNADGAVHIHAVAELPASRQERNRVAARLRQGLEQQRSATLREAAPRDADRDAQLIALPQLVATQTEYAVPKNGASVTVRTEVIRDADRSSDTLIVSSRSEHQLKPHHNGHTGNSIVIPGRYRYFLQLFAPDTEGTFPTLAGAKPASAPSTELVISEEHATTTRYGFGLSREVNAGLEGKVPTAGAKASFSFEFSREYTARNALSFALKDYSIATSSERPSAQTSRAYWDLNLAQAIAATPDYFGRSPSPAKMTPSMQQVTANGSAVWLVPGTFAGNLNVLAGGTIDNLEFNGRGIEKIPDPRPQPSAGVTIQADSPYLTREVTVFIQSKAGNGGCLRDGNGVVRITPCPDTTQGDWLNDVHAQWQLDSLGRYYNRGSKKCMQILARGAAPGGDGEIVTRPCTTNRDQRWEWQADRIHTLHGDGHPEWRMFVGAGDIVGVRTDDRPEYQSIPVNPYHILLNPWSSYPRKPGSNDFIPRLGDIGTNPPISDEVKRLNASPANERWELIVLRQSLHR